MQTLIKFKFNELNAKHAIFNPLQKHPTIKKLTTLLSLVVISHFCFAQTYAKHGMVVSDNTVASIVGVDILEKGGNVIDNYFMSFCC